jgi:SAM-dependent methyltransferase
MKTVKKNYDKIAEEYDRLYSTPYHLAENEYITSAIRKLWDINHTVCDLACGTGLLLDYQYYHPEKYIGVDISRKMIDQAKQKHPGHWFIVDDANRYLRRSEPGEHDAFISLFGGPSYLNMGLWAEMARLVPRNGYAVMMPYASSKHNILSHVSNNGLEEECRYYTEADLELVQRIISPMKMTVIPHKINSVLKRSYTRMGVSALIKLYNKYRANIDNANYYIMILTWD